MKKAILLLLCATASAVTPAEYEAFFRSPTGLSLSASEAASLAKTEATMLDQSGVTVESLQALRDVLYKSSGLNLNIADVRAQIFRLAYQKVSALKLQALYDILSGNWWTAGGLTLPVAEAQSRSMELAVRKTEPEQLRAIYEVLYGSFGLQLPQKDSQVAAMEQAAAGADPATFKSTYLAAKKAGKNPGDCMAAASASAVQANMQGLARRFAKDAEPYTASGFQSHFQGSWLSEWLSSPIETRVGADQHEYTAAEFSEYYGAGWVAQWANSKVATQVRFAKDRKPYTIKEFLEYYPTDWQSQWAAAAIAPCQECRPFEAAVIV